MQRNPRHKDEIQTRYNTRYRIRRDGRKRLGPRSPGRLQDGCKAETDINTGKHANNPSSSERASTHLHHGRKDRRATQSHRPAATKLQGEPSTSGHPPPPPAPLPRTHTARGDPGPGAAMNSSPGSGRVPRHTGNSIGTAGRGGVNNSGTPLAYTTSRKDEASLHRSSAAPCAYVWGRKGKPVC